MNPFKIGLINLLLILGIIFVNLKDRHHLNMLGGALLFAYTACVIRLK